MCYYREMATKKKTASPQKKSSTAKSTPAKKPAVKKAPVKPVKRAKAVTSTAQKAAKSQSSPESKVATTALKSVDQAAEVLRALIKNSANTSEKARIQAKQKAHTLLNKASGELNDFLKSGTSVLRKAINRLP